MKIFISMFYFFVRGRNLIMGISRNMKIKTVYGCFLLFVALALPSCNGNDGSEVVSPIGQHNTYTCSCECETSTIDGPLNDYVKYDKVWVCAEDQAEADLRCPAECENYLSDEYRKLQNLSSVKLCKVAQPAKMTEENVCSKVGLQAAVPKYTTIEGPVDFGQSYVTIAVPSKNDSVRIPLKGKVAIVGGNCPGQICPIEIWYTMLTAKESTVTTKQGHKISHLVGINEGVWSGIKNPDNSFVLSPNSYFTLSGDLDGSHKVRTMNPNTYFKGKIDFGQSRNKGNSGIVQSNALIIDGNFTDGTANMLLHLHIWITNCQPSVQAEANCWPGLDQNERHLYLGSTLGLLGNLQNQDLCNAMKASDTTSVCTASGDLEFPTFSCTEQPLPQATDTSAVASRLSLHWQDAHGRDIGSEPILFLDYMPSFPLTLMVQNEWGQAATDTIQNAPTGGACPPQVLWLKQPTQVNFPAGFISRAMNEKSALYVTPSLPKGSYTFILTGRNTGTLLARVGNVPTKQIYDCRANSGRKCTVKLQKEGSIYLLVFGKPSFRKGDYILTGTSK